MTPEERDLRRALDARSGEPSVQFRAQLSAALDEGRPASGLMQAVSVVVVVAITLGMVGVLLMSRGARTGHEGSMGGLRYTVTTRLMAAKGGPLRACFSEPLPSMPIGCYGVDVTNVDAQSIAGVVNYPNGTVGTPEVKLVGTWDGTDRLFRLTEQPLQVKPFTSTPPRVVTQAPPPPSGKTPGQILSEIRRDEPNLLRRGIVILTSGEGSDGAEITLAVADSKSVQYLYDTYGRVKILGWLQPVGGVTPVPSPSPTPAIFMPTTAQVSAPSRDVVWVFVASSLLFRSTDRGATWEQRALPPRAGGGWVPAFSFVDAQNGWYLVAGAPETQCNGAGAEIWHTTDGAATWQLVAQVQRTQPQRTDSGIAYAQCKEALSFVDQTHGFLGAWDQNHRPTVYRTSDAGKTWSSSTLPDPPGFVSQTGGTTLRLVLVKGFGSTLLALASGNGPPAYVFRSTDSGATWAYLATAVDAGANYPTFVTASRWLILNNNGSGQETNDSGKNWHPFSTDYADAAGVASTFVFADGGVGYGTVRGGIERTVDGGSHWIRIKTPGVYQP